MITPAYVERIDDLNRLIDGCPPDLWREIEDRQNIMRRLDKLRFRSTCLDQAVDCVTPGGRGDADALLHLSRAIPALSPLCDRLRRLLGDTP